MSIFYSRQSVLEEIDKWRKLFVLAARLVEIEKSKPSVRNVLDEVENCIREIGRTAGELEVMCWEVANTLNELEL